MSLLPNDYTPADTLVAIMITISASDETIRTSELVTIERIINHLPAFADFDIARLKDISNGVLDLFAEEDGLDILWEGVRATLPERLFETAYAMACDVAVADGKVLESELQMLEDMRHELNIDRLSAAAIERGARARHMVV
ncbi:tellurite resistance TerB family protein [uncultured Boseongicola sp.]|uniref:tellurite resistance TerB family protein n=1 Tax=uncultured Boseongicola sp. TaxID=1648499 RepID=UPI0026201872|nr:tellurite resistance TerB family protein [uncultured Boseongicola sp.]